MQISADDIDPQGEHAAQLPQDQLIAGKFKSVDDLVSSYKELESRLGASRQAIATDEEDSAGDNSQDAGDDQQENRTGNYDFFVTKTDEMRNEERALYGDAVADALDIAGIDAAALGEYHYKNGTIPEEAYNAFAEAGYSRQIVDAYFRGVVETADDVREIAQKEVKAIMNAVGGEKEYASMIRWAAANLPREEVEQFNQIVATNNAVSIRWAVKGMNAQFKAAEGNEPNLIGSGKAGRLDVFHSHVEAVNAVKDPRWGKDPEYTAQIRRKLHASDVFTVN